jgi:ABC-type lipoprotein release transport system permease subunit
MAAVWYRARAELRRRWRATLALALLVGLVGAVVLSVVAGARRSASSYRRFSQISRSADVTLYASDSSRLDQVQRLPEVQAVGRIIAPALAPLDPSQPSQQFTTVASPDGSLLAAVDRVRVVKGRAALQDQADELVISEQVAIDFRLTVGQRVTFRSFAPSQFQSLATGPAPEPAGPTVPARVVGIVRSPQDVANRTSEVNGPPAAYLTPAFYRTHRDRIAAFEGVSRVDLRRGEADLPAFSEAARRIYSDDPEFAITPASAETATVEDAIRVVVFGLLLFAAAAGLAGLVALGQALSRHLSHAAADQPVLAGLGMTRPQRIAAALLALAPCVAGGALMAAVGAVLASPLMPIGLARRAEADPGLSVDAVVIGLGLVAVALTALALSAAAAWWSTRTTAEVEAAAPSGRSRPSAVARALAAAGLSPPATTGARMALEPGRGRTAVPVRSGIVATVAGAAGLVAAAVFAASLTALIHNPARYGWNWDADLPGEGSLGGGESVVEQYGPELVADPTIADLAAVRIGHANMAGGYIHVLDFSALKGSVAPIVIEGRRADSADEVVLGTATLRRLGAATGDSFEAPGAEGPLTLRIVGRAAIPALDTDGVADDGALMTAQGADRLATTQSHSELVLNWAPGTDEDAARQSLEQRVGTVVADRPPSDVTNLKGVQAFPAALAVFLGLLAMLAVGHALMVTIRRRGRDLAVLKVLGFRPRQVSATVAWQASLMVLLGLGLGVPLGVAAGRWAWALVANGVGVVNRPEIPVVALALIVGAALLMANVVAAVPAWAAARARPALALRAE